MILGFDFGMKYIGVATGQLVTKTATPLTSLRATDGIPDWDEIAKLIEEWKPNTLVVGLPYNMDGTSQHLTACAKKFSNRLREKYKLPVMLVDERLTTWEAKQDQSRSTKLTVKQLNALNAQAATIILQQWLSEQ